MMRILILAYVLISCGACMAQVKANDSKGNIINLADPTIFYHNGIYYLYGTGARDGFRVYTSVNKIDWDGPKGLKNGYTLDKKDVYGDHGFWPPQVFHYQDKFYMAYTANESIAIAQSDNPLGPFIQHDKNPLQASVKQIDPYIFFDDNGKKYLYHVQVANGGNRIYVAELKNDFSGIKRETLKLCIQATESWENIKNSKWTVTEGPSVFKKENKYFLIYSANHFKSKDYAVGYAVGDSPYGPWEKYKGNPILRRELVNHNGTGHGDFFYDENGALYYVFHTHRSDSLVSPRKTAMVKVEFTSFKRNDNNKNKNMSVEEDSFHFLIQKAD